jgi:excisionase family DNA binding protein
METAQTTGDRLLLRGTEVAELLGCSRAMAYRMMQAGVIPVVRLRGKRAVRVPRQALISWIEKNTRQAGGVHQ